MIELRFHSQVLEIPTDIHVEPPAVLGFHYCFLQTYSVADNDVEIVKR